MAFDTSSQPDTVLRVPELPHAPAGKALCQYCSKPFKAGGGIANHEAGCVLNPRRRERRKQRRQKCPKCRTMISISQFDRHVPKCKGRKGDAVVVNEISSTAVTSTHPLAATDPDTSVTELLVEMLFPLGMPTHAEFVRAFREWLDATDRLVAIADVDR
jgi:hypothetical protein